MTAEERDSTDDWAMPKNAGTFLLGEIEAKVDEAVAVARASEEGVREIGQMALDAARQARRAAEAAEAASVAAVELERETETEPVPEEHRAAGEVRLRRFRERCELVKARLRALERRPGSLSPASAAEARRRGGG